VFQNGKTLPIDRAAGISQPIMAAAASRAAAGDWVHVFPEAKVGYTGQLMPLKRGIGKLFCDSLKENPT
jgi:monolysocardiolipin acyltransferase